MRFETVGSTALILALACGGGLGGCGDSGSSPDDATRPDSSEASTSGVSPSDSGDTPGTSSGTGSGGPGSGAAEGVSPSSEDGTFMGRVVGGPGTNGATGADAGPGLDGTATGALEVSPARVQLTGVRGLARPVAGAEATLHNSGATALTVSQIDVSGANAALFQLAGVPRFPVEIAAGADLSLTVQLLTAGALPPAPRQDDGGTALTASLDVRFDGGTASASLQGLVQTTVTHEVTLGQILDAAGIPLNVGRAQTNANPNTGDGTATLPGVEAGTDEVAAGLFQKAGPGDVTVSVIARFSPKGPMPFGWYPQGAPQTRNEVATMASAPDAQTSDKARMLAPPVTGAPSFDPGDQVFGIWVYTDQLSQRFDRGGTASNGDYDYSEDRPNSPANVHRTKVYPMKSVDGAVVPNSYLLAIEEAANGDYQDYVLVLENVEIAP